MNHLHAEVPRWPLEIANPHSIDDNHQDLRTGDSSDRPPINRFVSFCEEGKYIITIYLLQDQKPSYHSMGRIPAHYHIVQYPKKGYVVMASFGIQLLTCHLVCVFQESPGSKCCMALRGAIDLGA